MWPEEDPPGGAVVPGVGPGGAVVPGVGPGGAVVPGVGPGGAVVPEAPTAVEIARGWIGGFVAGPSCRGAGAGRTPRQALEDVLADALAQPPCLVAFSGGRDSSLLLAAAVTVARRRRLPLPVAVTERFDEFEEADERHWQELVVSQLGVADWERLPATDHVDLLGADAAASLRRYGLLWPPLAHTRAWFVPRLLGSPPAGGRPVGTVVDGEGGDEVLGARRLSPIVRLVGPAGRRGPGQSRRPDRHVAEQVARGLAPSAVRRSLVERAVAGEAPAPWLAPSARRAFLDDLVADLVGEPLRWSAAVRRHLRHRGVALGRQGVDLVLAGAGVRAVHPLLEPAVVDAVAGAGGPFGFGSRAATLAACFAGLLPDVLVRRPGKARFNRMVFGPRARAFAAGWDGTGVPTDLVDAEALSAAWAEPEPPALSFLALHAAWLASEGFPSDRAPDRVPSAVPGTDDCLPPD